MKTDTTTEPLTHKQLAQFAGDLVRFRHPINRSVIYTPGVQFLAEKAGACWLIDVIASHLTPAVIEKATLTDERIRHLHFWKLEVGEDRSAQVTARADSDCPPFVFQKIPFTDFPLDHVSIWAGFDRQRWTLYLPSEH